MSAFDNVLTGLTPEVVGAEVVEVVLDFLSLLHPAMPATRAMERMVTPKIRRAEREFMSPPGVWGK
jgi:hypothetical protein